MKKNLLLLLSFPLLLIACHVTKKIDPSSTGFNPYRYSIQKKAIADNGAVVSAHPLASQAGLEILKKGGNAVDAAIATQLALAVVYPNAGNLGGGGFMVAKLSDGKEISIDYREMAPGKAHRDMYIDSAGNARTDKSQEGHLSSGVPGTVAGLFASAKYAKLSFDKLIEPAIQLAEKGFVISKREANSLNGLQDDLKKNNTERPVFVKDNGWKEGDTLIQKDLANTLKRIKQNGAAGFYEGETAKLIVEEMKRGNGIITPDDLKNYVAKIREPHVFHYKDYKVIGMPMPSSGGVLLHQMMKMIESRNIASMGFHSPAAVQLMIEAERRAYADRAEYMGDADYYKVPVKMLTNDVYIQQRMRDYDSTKATPSSLIKPGSLPVAESEETTHLSVIDKEGNAVAVTTTLNNSYGSYTVVGGAGFFLNDEMDDFSIKPGVPNMYGAVGGEANAIQPGKRMLSSMTPTIVLKNDKPFLVVGTPGGTTIPTSVFQTLVNIIEFNMSTEDAVYKPKFHHQWLPDSVDVENAFPIEVITALQQMGYHIVQRGGIGRTEVIKVSPDGKFEAVADNRGDDDARGW
ncbi:gamma-glutamyltransferase [Terrimonas alba]|uniref:gamma-glutamyltransferase n=1 Tax=Terrimonas alba TaxID=3349636 RepID=UPI0035F38E95